MTVAFAFMSVPLQRRWVHFRGNVISWGNILGYVPCVLNRQPCELKGNYLAKLPPDSWEIRKWPSSSSVLTVYLSRFQS